MDRNRFLRDSMRSFVALFAAIKVPSALRAEEPQDVPCAESLKKVEGERDFIDNWVTDLLDTMDQQLDEKTRIRLMEGCGRGCYLRHQFKQDIAAKGCGSLEKLIKAYDENFEIWREGDTVHIRYGKVSKKCYCPVVRNRHPGGKDLHCECTRGTHQTIFETALGRPVPVEVLESVRRGGVTCHFLAHV